MSEHTDRRMCAVRGAPKKGVNLDSRRVPSNAGTVGHSTPLGVERLLST
jgi:hypothetical protein